MELLYSTKEESSLEHGFVAPDSIMFIEDKKNVRVWSPIFDGEGGRLGYVQVEYSKAILNAQARSLAIKTSLFALLCTIIAITAMYYVVTKGVTDPILKTRNMLQDIAEGECDLTQRLEVLSKDELGQLATWMNTFLTFTI